jgi:hypothetical protein
MTVDFEIFDSVRQLRRVGLRPPEQLARRITQAGPAALQQLLELATDVSLFEEEPPTTYAPLHALRLLGELNSPDMIEPLLDAFPLDIFGDEQNAPPAIWDAEAPQIIGHLGRPALAALWAYADDTSKPVPSRSAALSALAYATAIDPTVREEVLAGLRERISNADDALIASYALVALANIGAPELYGEIMAQFRQGRFDTEIIPPGAARQLLLSKGDSRLACARHPLWERYDQHGPFDLSTRTAAR